MRISLKRHPQPITLTHAAQRRQQSPADDTYRNATPRPRTDMLTSLRPTWRKGLLATSATLASGCDGRAALGAGIFMGLLALLNIVSAFRESKPSEGELLRAEIARARKQTSWTPLSEAKIAALAPHASDPFVRLVSGLSHYRAERNPRVADAAQAYMFTEYFRCTGDEELMDAMGQLTSRNTTHFDITWAFRHILRRLHRKDDTTENHIIRSLLHTYAAQVQLAAHTSAFRGYPCQLSSFCIYTMGMGYAEAHRVEMKRRRDSLEYVVANTNAAATEIAQAQLDRSLQHELGWNVLDNHRWNLEGKLRNLWRRDVTNGHVTDLVRQVTLEFRDDDTFALPALTWTPGMDISVFRDSLNGSWFSVPWSLL